MSAPLSWGALPLPAPGKSGWPWTAEPPNFPPAMKDGRPWPNILVVTPSFNQGRFIEETIRSVLLQGYPRLEYVIIDGGSNDETVSILERYTPWLAHWRSERDRGQAHALNKGFFGRTADICAYINSDDYYLPGAFAYVAEAFMRRGFDLLFGRRERPRRGLLESLRRSHWVEEWLPFSAPFLIESAGYSVSQESSFWSGRLAEGDQFDENLHLVMDVDWFCRIAAREARVILTSRRIGHFREHPDSKTAHPDRAPLEVSLIRQRWRLCPEAAPTRTAVIDRFRRSLPGLTFTHLLGGVAEFAYRHPPSFQSESLSS